MLGGMQDFELRVPRILDHAEREHGEREIVTWWADGSITRTNWAGIARDARKLSQALEKMGVESGDRIGTLGMNHAHHLVAWYGAIGVGGVIHTINPRLFDEQLVYIANHAEDKVLFYDRVFQPIIDRLGREVSALVKSPAFSKRIEDMGAEPVGNTPSEAASAYTAYLPVVLKLTADTGVTLD